MARITYVKKAAQRFRTVPVLDDEGRPVKVPVMRRDGTQKTTKSGRAVFMTKTVADKANPLPPETCESCREPIAIGTPYKWVKPKSGPYGGRKRSRHASCPNWRPSELTGSAALSTLYAAQEAAEDALSDWSQDSVDDVVQILQDLAEGVRDAAQCYIESADNMEDGFGHETAMSQEIREKGDHLESEADRVESDADDLPEDFDLDAVREEVLEDHVDDLEHPEEDYDWDDDPAGLADEVETKKTEWADEVLDAAQEIISSVETF